MLMIQEQDQSLLNKIHNTMDLYTEYCQATYKIADEIINFVGNNYSKQWNSEYYFDDEISVRDLCMTSKIDKSEWYIHVYKKNDKAVVDVPLLCTPIPLGGNKFSLNVRINNRYMGKVFRNEFPKNLQAVYNEHIKCVFYKNFTNEERKTLYNAFREDTENLIEIDNIIDNTEESKIYNALLKSNYNDSRITSIVLMFMLFYYRGIDMMAMCLTNDLWTEDELENDLEIN